MRETSLAAMHRRERAKMLWSLMVTNFFLGVGQATGWIVVIYIALRWYNW